MLHLPHNARLLTLFVFVAEGGRVTSDKTRDQLQPEGQQHHERGDARQEVLARREAVAGDADQSGGVDEVPDGLEQSAAAEAIGLGRPVERDRRQ